MKSSVMSPRSCRVLTTTSSNCGCLNHELVNSLILRIEIPVIKGNTQPDDLTDQARFHHPESIESLRICCDLSNEVSHFLSEWAGTLS